MTRRTVRLSGTDVLTGEEQLFDAWLTGGQVVIAMQLVEGETTLLESLQISLQWRQHDVAPEAAQELVYVVGRSWRRHAEGIAFGKMAAGLSAGLGGEREAKTLRMLATVVADQDKYDEAEALYCQNCIRDIGSDSVVEKMRRFPQAHASSPRAFYPVVVERRIGVSRKGR